MKLDYAAVRASDEIRTYITQADASLIAMGYTEHSFAHVTKCAETAAGLLSQQGYDDRQVELAKIAGYMHDIGNVVNRVDHAQSGAVMAFRILDKMGMDPEDVAVVITAIGNHDEHTAFPVNAVAAALILADKTDVRRSRVNYAVERSDLLLDKEKKHLTLSLTIDTEISAVMDYFEIFMTRMLLCRKAAEFFGLRFRLHINGSEVL